MSGNVNQVDDDLKRSTVIRLRGLPFHATEKDIRDFLKGLEIGPDGIVFQMTYQGKPSGQAYVQMLTPEFATLALERNRHHMGSRYIEVFRGTPSDMQTALRASARQSGGYMSNTSSGPGGGHGGEGTSMPGTGVPGMGGSQDMNFTGVVRIRGLPFSCTVADIVGFFQGLQIAPDGIFPTTHADGRPSGEAYVEFVTEEMSKRSMQFHRQKMGSRYIEVFRSSKGEMMQAVQQKMYGLYPSPFAQMTQMGMMNLMGMGSLGGGATGVTFPLDGSENVCLKLRGLPYNCSQQDIVDFFHGYEVVPDGVFILMGPSDRPTGEAYVEFSNSEEAGRAMERNRKNIGSRYIELFRVTKSDAILAMGGGTIPGYVAAAIDPSTQLLLLQQQQQLAALGASGWNVQDLQNPSIGYQGGGGTSPNLGSGQYGFTSSNHRPHA